MSKQKGKKYDVKIEKLPDKKIYINVGHLEKGTYELNIVHKKKVVNKVIFEKEDEK